MSINAVWWIGWSVAAMVVGRGLAANEPWRAVGQPEQEQLLEEAPTLQTESLGEPARGVQPWEHWAVPNPDGKSWDVLQCYLEYGWGQQELFVIDLGTGQVKSGHPIPTINSVYLSGRALGFDGKYYIVTHTRGGGGLHIFIYDPGTNSVEDGGIITRRGWQALLLRGQAVTPDSQYSPCTVTHTRLITMKNSIMWIGLTVISIQLLLSWSFIN